MRNLFFLAGAAALAVTAPAFAKPDKADKARGGPHSSARHAIHRDNTPDFRARRIVDVNRNGIADHRERRIDRDRDGIDDRRESNNRYAARGCPPGLAKKNNGCLPPGQAKKQFNVGQRIPSGYNFYTDYGSLPREYSTRYNLNDDYRYIRRDGYLYEVDPLTSLVRRAIGL